ncbi:MAG: tetratricopeptide repeat protein [Oscillospiraceae bacterium]|nr:tetratricopeptide repeat protein [Oscillospiraceae bacterium]
MGLKDLFKKTSAVQNKTKLPQPLNKFNDVAFVEYVLAHYGGSIGATIPQNKHFEIECERLKRKCRQERGENFSERIYLLEAAGDKIILSTPKALRLKARAYSWAGATCRRKTITSSIEYLGGNKWDEDLPNDIIILDGNKVRRQDSLLASVWMDLGNAYYGEKEYDNAENAYKNAVKLDSSLSTYLTFADFYKKIKQLNMAIDLLKNAKQVFNNRESQQRLFDRIKMYENLSVGIRPHEFIGYDRIETFYDRAKGQHKNREQKIYDGLKAKYKNTFEKHRELLGRMDFYLTKIKNNDNYESSINQEYIQTCLADIALYDDLVSFFTELNKLGLTNHYEIGDGYKKGYDIFKKLCSFYEKIGMYDEAINICNLAIEKGVTEDGTKGKMCGRLERLKKKSRK